MYQAMMKVESSVPQPINLAASFRWLPRPSGPPLDDIRR